MDWFWVMQQPKGQKRKGKDGDDNDKNKKRKPAKPKPEPVKPPEQHHILDPVAKDFLKYLRFKDLKSARQVCKKWKELSTEDFHNKSVTRLQHQMGDKTIDKDYDKRIYSSAHVKNLEFFQFRPTRFLGEIFELRGEKLNELTIHTHLFNFFLPVLRCCYEYMPNLTKLKFDNTSGPKSWKKVLPIRGRLTAPKIPKTCKKTLKLTSFSFRPFGEHTTKLNPAWKEWNRDEFMNYLKACPQLVELNLDIEPFSVLENFMEGFFEVKHDKAPVASGLTSLGLVINEEHRKDDKWDAKTRLLNSLYIASPLEQLRLHLSSPLDTWPKLLENAPTTLRSLTIYQSYSDDYRREQLNLTDLFKLTKNPLTNLSSLAIQLNSQCTSLVLGGGKLKENVRKSLENVRDFYCQEIEGKVVYAQVAALFPGLKILSAKLESRKEFMELLSLFGGGGLEELEVYCCNAYSFSDHDILGSGANGDPKDKGGYADIDMGKWKSFTGLRGMTELRRLRVKGRLSPLGDPSVFEGFLSMPNLKKLEFPSSSSSEKIFSDRASQALRENNLVPQAGDRYFSSRMGEHFM